MTKLKVKVLAAQNTSEALLESTVGRIEKLVSQKNYTFAENDPDVLFFLTGGTERTAIKLVFPGHFYILIGSQFNNAYASATEVKAYLNEINIPSILLDEEALETPNILKNLHTAKTALKNLKGQKLGLIGQVSDWLISSDVSSDTLKEKLGIILNIIPWASLPHFSEYKPSDTFLDTFSDKTTIDLTQTGQVNELFTQIIKSKNLNAITVECFPMVLKECVTACLPLAKFNNDGIPAGCEGDLTAIAGMMLCKELTGIIPWMANTNKITEEVCMFSHCTISPDLLSGYKIKTHFETGVGTAIEGDFKDDLVTIFRFDKHFSKAFIALANISSRPKLNTACRTQIEVKLSKQEVKLLKKNPLGNHHLIFPGDCKNVLQITCKLLGIEIL